MSGNGEKNDSFVWWWLVRKRLPIDIQIHIQYTKAAIFLIVDFFFHFKE
jgi:hypothetical protein